jgi:hypothetical protein
MMPHEVIQHSLGHAFVPEVPCIKFLVTPLNPSSLSWNTIDEAKSFHLKKIKHNQGCFNWSIHELSTHSLL